MSRNSEYTHRCRVSWKHTDDTRTWDTICIRAIELFGMPGDRYVTEITENYMDWCFRDHRDRLLFKLKFSERVE